MEELTAAGYEAYNVTGSNYDALEEALNTDFADMGLNRDGSYIIVISGEDTPNGSTNPNSRGGEGPDQDFLEGGGGSSFSYTYNGTTYLMRYVTVAPSANAGTAQTRILDLLEGNNNGEKFKELAKTFISIYIDYKTQPIPLGTALSICGILASDVNEESEARMDYCVSVNWFRSRLQIYNVAMAIWETWCVVDHASYHALWDGRYYSNKQNKFISVNQENSQTYYSTHYFDYDWRKQKAVNGLLTNSVYTEYVGDVRVYSTLTQYYPVETTAPELYFYCSYA